MKEKFKFLAEQATLPKRFEEKTLQDLEIGCSAWTVPWAMFADEKGLLWLHGGYSIDRNGQGGTAQMLVTRSDYQGYTVDISNCIDNRWRKEVPSYVGEGFVGLPVIRLIY